MNFLQPRFLLPIALVSLGLADPLLAQEKTPNPQEAPRIDKKKGGDGIASQGGDSDKFAQMKQQIEDLRKAGKLEEANRLQHELASAWQRQNEKKNGAPSNDGTERLMHVQEAIKHLNAAGLKEPAQDLTQLAERMRSEIERQRQASKGEAAGSPDLQREVEQLRGQMQKMMQEVQELRSQLKKTPEGDRKKE